MERERILREMERKRTESKTWREDRVIGDDSNRELSERDGERED